MNQRSLLAGSALAAAALLGGLAPTAFAEAPKTPVYTVVKTVPLGAPDRWDYVVFDAPSGRVYVAHGDRVSVVDGQDGTLLGEVTGIPGGTHGVGISTATGKGYTDDGKAGVAVAFDLKTLKSIKRIPAKPDADGIAFDSVSGHIFVVDGDSKTVTVIDPATDAAVANVDLGGGLEYAVAGGDGKLYVNGAEKRELIRLDTKRNVVDARWPIPGCASPHGLAIDPAGRRAFVSCVNAVMTVVNIDTGAVVASLPIGPGTDATVFDPGRKLAFSSGGAGALSVIQEVDPQTFVSLGSIKTAPTGRTMSINPKTGRLFIAAADIDPNAPVPPAADGRPGRPKPLPGTLKLLFMDPAR
jgi:YVTN family beta-propeller protein